MARQSRICSPNHTISALALRHVAVLLFLLSRQINAFLPGHVPFRPPSSFHIPVVSSRPSTPVETPAQRVQHALAPEDILSNAVMNMKYLKAGHLATAVLRIGKGLLQPKEATRRKDLRESQGFQTLLPQTLDLISTTSASTVHILDFLLGLALLDYPLCSEFPTRHRVEQLYQSILAARANELSPGDISSLVWCWRKFHLDVERLPPHFIEVTSALPFRVLIGALSGGDGASESAELLDLAALRAEIDLQRDTIQLSPHKTVDESRLTAWQGTQPFFYSGKEMPAREMTARVARIRDRLAVVTGVYYDCVLINLYETGKVGMRYHVDPDQGIYFSTNTVVVSVGDTREFCLRSIAEEVEEEVGPKGIRGEGEKGSAGADKSHRKSQDRSASAKAVEGRKGKRATHHRFFVAQSDAVEMTRECQWRYQHAVKVCEHAEDAGARMSLVFKQTLDGATQDERYWIATYLSMKDEGKRTAGSI